NYNPFRNFGKNVFINFGRPLNRAEVMQHQTDGRMFLTFNEQLRSEMKRLVAEIGPSDKKTQRERLSVPVPLLKKVLLPGPALLGFLFHAPLYFTAKALNNAYFDNDHYDSSLVGMLLLAYPLYLLLWYLLAGVLTGWSVAVLVFVLLPFFAWSCVQLKPQV
ncbi:MAG TPA: hypothetical protein VFT06_16570, partial [Flavisolibacter sp.]|nr:hypothetical protein [Flavisolibacter sp.]